MCRLTDPKPTKRKYCWKVYRYINGELYTPIIYKKHILNKKYKAQNIKREKIRDIKLINHDIFVARHCYDSSQKGFIGYTKLLYAKEGIVNYFYKVVIVKCLMEQARQDIYKEKVECKYLTPLKIVYMRK